MKIFSRLFLFMLAAALFACSSDDEEITPDQELENAELSFNAGEEPVSLPFTIDSNSPEQAQFINTFVSQANSMASVLSNLEVPAGAEVSSNPVGRTSNGRVLGTEEGVLVYTWSATGPNGNTISVAYQISETSSRYIFEMFWKWNEGDFVKYMHAEESKNEREGFLEFFSITQDSGEAQDFVFRYEWNEEADGTFNFSLHTPENSFRIDIVVNPDNSGALDYYLGGNIRYELTWNGDGTGGTYVYYNSDGTIEASGDWTN